MSSEMALTGEENEIRMPLEAGLDHAPPPPHQHLQHQDNPAAGGDRDGDGGSEKIRYRECLKNHAAGNGGNATDGCGEFMPGGKEGTEQSLNCAACNCHRSFHRKETPSGGGAAAPQSTPPTLPSFASMTQRSNAWASLASQSAKNAAFGCGATAPPPPAPPSADFSSKELNFIATQYLGSAPPRPVDFSSKEMKATQGSAPAAADTRAKKRFRTKFTQEQKDKMMEFAEKIGWRIPKEEESMNGVQRFCGEIGVKRQVFKVWMQNNKNSAKNNSSSLQSPS